MGGVAVLHPQDSLKDHSSPIKSNRTIKFNHTYTNTPSQIPNFIVSDSRRRTPPTKGTRKKNERNTETVETSAAMASKTVVIGQVKLLKRGEALNQSSSPNRLEPDPKMPSKPMKNKTTEFFAGSAFADSPPPSSVPLPGFFTKNFVAAASVDPTTDLRRILGLSLS
ncbi:uncharacterized protein LOC112521316 [Cynara cardunculus var. scolymus]|uniref:uncharacterized protein LOC112521316 n=1 Tax=Cynara cardunculus var. scolymus TaxID=59895 RepID=UPI000D6295BE|nr:uncharacterized protein LOC112521316 [Cynara cardunculus var. scolymus]